MPADQKITRTEEEKVEKYQHLKSEGFMEPQKSQIITPIMIGALGSISKGAKTWFGKLDVPACMTSWLFFVVIDGTCTMYIISITEDAIHDNIYHSMYFFLPFHWLRAHHVTCKLLPTNKT